MNSNAQYRRKIFKELGMSFQEIFSFWVGNYDWDCVATGDMKTIKIDEVDSDWKAFKASLKKSLPYIYKTDNGLVASGYSEAEYKAAVKTNPGLTTWQRFMKGLNIPATPSAEVLAFAGISSVLNFGFQELVSDPVYAGTTASATMRRMDMAEHIQWIHERLVINQ